MKAFFPTLFLFVISLEAFAQSVTFYPSEVRYDQTTLLMNGTFGDWTNYQYVELSNKSGHQVTVSVHLHDELPFIYFVNSQNNAVREISVDMPANSTYTLKVIAKLASGRPVVYNDLLGLDILYENKGSSYIELKASAYFREKEASHGHHGDASNTSGTSTGSFNRPSGYEYIAVNNQPARWNVDDLPLTMYSNHAAYGFPNDYSTVVQKAMSMWNAAGRSVGLTVDFFKMVNDPSRADIQIDWSGKVIKESGADNALGIAYPGRNLVGMWPFDRYNGIGAVGETLCQELCHLLGVEHSEVRYDIMNGTAHGEWHDLSEIEITSRDRQMLGWLYSLQKGKYFAF